MVKNPFVVRVYGIYIHPEHGILVSDEYVFGRQVTKFPGGGLEFGEGTVDCIVREMKEETGFSFRVLSHFYTTDFFVPSAFNSELQVISIYYRIEPEGPFKLPTNNNPFDFPEQKEGAQAFRFISLERINQQDFTLVIDQRVGELLRKSAGPAP